MDVEIEAVVLAVLRKRRDMKRQKEKSSRRMWSRKFLLNRAKTGGIEARYQQIISEEYFSHNNFIRMGNQEFGELLHLLEPHITKKTTHLRKPISAKARLIITLKYLATGETQQSLQFNAEIAQNTISKIISETVYWIYKLLKNKYLKGLESYTESEWIQIAQDYHKEWNFVTLGSMDGKHCTIQAPPNSGSTYFNYRNENSLVLMAICDAKYRFIYATVGANGRVSDGGIFNRSNLCAALEANELNIPAPRCLPNSHIRVPFFFISDDAFSLREYNMKPFPGVHLTEEQRYFNCRLSRARRVIESSFGMLSNKFEMLKKPINVEPVQATANILATVVLHNYLRTKELEKTQQNQDGSRYRLGRMRISSNVAPRFEDVNDRARLVREKLKFYYNYFDYIEMKV